jgi:hypothetical protein
VAERGVRPAGYLDVDPRTLRLPPSRALTGADPSKLQRQIARHGKSTAGMPRLWVYRCSDGELMIYNGVTRATKLRPGQLVPIEVIDDYPAPGVSLPTVQDRVP